MKVEVAIDIAMVSGCKITVRSISDSSVPKSRSLSDRYLHVKVVYKRLRSHTIKLGVCPDFSNVVHHQDIAAIMMLHYSGHELAACDFKGFFILTVRTACFYGLCRQYLLVQAIIV